MMAPLASLSSSRGRAPPPDHSSQSATGSCSLAAMPPLLAERAVASAWDLPVCCRAVVSVSLLPTEPGGHSTSFIPLGQGVPAWVWGPGSLWESVTCRGKVRSLDGPEGSTVVGLRHPTPRGALGRAAKSHGAGRVVETRELAAGSPTAPHTVQFCTHSTHISSG